MSNLGQFLPGQDAGFLGSEFQPFVSGDPSRPDYQVPGLTLPAEVSLDRLNARRSLLESVDRSLDLGWPAAEGMDHHYKKAYELVSISEARRAFDLSEESPAVRERYGLDPDNPREKEARQFGGLPHLGQ